MVDKVKPLKIEDTTSGTELDMFPRETNPANDYLASKGLALENSDASLIDLNGSGEVQITDPVVGTKTADDLQSTARVSSNDTTPSYLFNKLVAGDGITLTELNNGSNETLSIIVNAGDFGTVYTAAESDAESTTTSTTFQEKLSLTTPSLDAGTYYVGWYFEYATDVNNKELEFRVQIDDTTDVLDINPEGRADKFVSSAGFNPTNFTSGVHTIDIDYRRLAPNTTAKIRSARLILWRIA